MRPKIRVQNDKQLNDSLCKKMKAGLEKLKKLKKEWDSADYIYQAIEGSASRGGAVDSSVISAIGGMVPAPAATAMSNRVGCAMLNHKAKLTMSEPTVVARALDQDHWTKLAQEYTQQYCDNLYLSTPIKRILSSKVYLDVVIKGMGVLYINWDFYGGEVEKTYRDGSVKMTGDHKYRHVCMNRFIIDPTASIFEVDAKWCIEGVEESIEEMMALFPNHTKLIDELCSGHKNGNDGVEQDETFEDTERATSLIIWHYWEKPSIANGMRGAHVRFFYKSSGDITIIDRTPLHNQHGQLPFATITDLDLVEDCYGLSRAVLAAPHHDRLKQFFTDIDKNIKLFGHTKILVPTGTNANIQNPDGLVMIPYASGTTDKPMYLQPSAMTNDVWKFYQIIGSEIDMIYSSGEFDRGEVNRELSSYTVLTAIERSEAKLIDLFNKKKEFIKRLYMLSIADAQQFIKKEREFAITGQQLHHKYQSFKGENLKGRVGLTVDFGLYMPIDPAARKQQFFELLKIGAFEKAGLPMKDIVSKMIGGELQDVKELCDMAKDVQEAEISRLIEGLDAPVQPYHEHLAHLEVTAKFMNEMPFEMLPKEIKQRIFDHYLQHNQEAAKIAAKAQPQGPVPNTPPPPAA